MSFNKILVAIDRSSLANTLFKHAIGLAKQNSASIHFFHCLELKSNYCSALKIEREITEAKQLLADYQNIAKTEKLEVKFSCEVGKTGTMICQSARELQADLILLGCREERGLISAIAGNVSSYVVNHAPCSVLVVQENINSRIQAKSFF
jgi:nucleotide-binding universal stress UspA family protein